MAIDVSRLFSVKIDNLKYEWDDFINARNEIKDTFRKYGEVMDCHLPRERSFGFVRYETENEARDAIEEMDGKEMFGSEIKCSLATQAKKDMGHLPPRPSGRGGGRSRSRRGGGGRSRTRRRDDSRDRRRDSRPRGRRRRRDDSRSDSRPRHRRR
eukprot:TRINITY_DN110974_c0_g1_i1.p1 TRINITY_DN110974_c0_g1~~TRINITY_DN110974_c0_g1_i1.p1  ORF type:complete len:170 (-),score=16.35 TRINITY_DN110974_c0_g1_i1:69-533(-)